MTAGSLDKYEPLEQNLFVDLFDRPSHIWIRHPEYPAVGRFVETQEYQYHIP